MQYTAPVNTNRKHLNPQENSINEKLLETQFFKNAYRKRIFSALTAITGSTATSLYVDLTNPPIDPIIPIDIEGIIDGISVKPTGFTIGSALDGSGNITGSDAVTKLWSDFSSDSSMDGILNASVLFGDKEYDVNNTVDFDSEFKCMVIRSPFRHIAHAYPDAKYIQFKFAITRPSGDTTTLRFHGHLLVK